MVLPVTLTGCIIGSLLVLLLYPTLVVRFIIRRYTLHLPTGNTDPQLHVYSPWSAHCTVQYSEDWSLAWAWILRGVKFFFGTGL